MGDRIQERRIWEWFKNKSVFVVMYLCLEAGANFLSVLCQSQLVAN